MKVVKHEEQKHKTDSAKELRYYYVTISGYFSYRVRVLAHNKEEARNNAIVLYEEDSPEDFLASTEFTRSSDVEVEEVE